MPRGHLLELLPPWLIFVGTAALVLLSIYGGIFLARFRRKRSKEDQETSVNTIVGAATALLAFLLAFTFGLAASRFDAKRASLLDEVNAIGTTFLRTRLIPEPHGAAVRALLKEYVDIRVELARHPENGRAVDPAVGANCKGSCGRTRRPWRKRTSGTPRSFRFSWTPLTRCLTCRPNALRSVSSTRCRWFIWIALFTLTILAMLEVGYLLGLSDHTNWLLVLMLSLALSTVITLIADLDRTGTGGTGLIKVEQQPMIDLQQSIHEQMR